MLYAHSLLIRTGAHHSEGRDSYPHRISASQARTRLPLKAELAKGIAHGTQPALENAKGHRFFDGYQFNASGCRCGLAPAWNLLVVMVRHPGDKGGGAGPQNLWWIFFFKKKKLWWQLRNRRPGNLSEANPGGGRRGDP